ncbi:flagellar protein FlaG [uncultured Clostridium sp.]|uniref:flagellar protein FlaG n=1 Tax=uncultured Clostridium sp. TaxID=59620 RepID=UPI0028EB6228|nr:flagellar protein FlaG [uncultured Clostridium sp.]
MDVSGIQQNTINFNGYDQDYSVSKYTDDSVAIPQVKSDEEEKTLNNDEKNQEYNKKDLDNAIYKINNFMKDDNIYAEYSYHKETKTTMIKLIDENTKEVILEIPPKKILDMVASMCKQFGLFNRKA